MSSIRPQDLEQARLQVVELHTEFIKTFSQDAAATLTLAVVQLATKSRSEFPIEKILPIEKTTARDSVLPILIPQLG